MIYARRFYAEAKFLFRLLVASWQSLIKPVNHAQIDIEPVLRSVELMTLARVHHH